MRKSRWLSSVVSLSSSSMCVLCLRLIYVETVDEINSIASRYNLGLFEFPFEFPGFKNDTRTIYINSRCIILV